MLETNDLVRIILYEFKWVQVLHAFWLKKLQGDLDDDANIDLISTFYFF